MVVNGAREGMMGVFKHSTRITYQQVSEKKARTRLAGGKPLRALFAAGCMSVLISPVFAWAKSLTWDGELAASDPSDPNSYWYHSKSGLFGQTTNWTSDQLPARFDDVVIPAGTPISKMTSGASASLELNSLDVSNGNFQILSTLKVTAPSHINGLTGGTGTLHANSTLTFDGTNTNPGVTLRGTAGYVNNGDFTIDNPVNALFVNNATTRFGSGSQQIDDFVNKGTAILDGSQVNTTGAVRFVNRASGTIEIPTNSSNNIIGGEFQMQGGNIHLSNGSSLEIGGAVTEMYGDATVDDGALLTIAGPSSQTRQITGVFNVSGQGDFFANGLTFSSGFLDIDLNGPSGSPDAGFRPGMLTIDGRSQLINRGHMQTPLGSTTQFSGDGTVNNIGVFDVTGPTTIDVLGFTNGGDITISGLGAIVIKRSIVNQGMVELNNARSISSGSSCGIPCTFENIGGVNRTGTGRFEISSRYNQSNIARTQVNAGELRLSGGGELRGTFFVQSTSSVLEFMNVFIDTGSGAGVPSLEGNGLIRLGDIFTAGEFVLGRGLFLDVGDYADPSSSSGFELQNGRISLVNGNVIDNRGIFRWGGGGIEADLNNAGLLEIGGHGKGNQRLSGELINHRSVEQTHFLIVDGVGSIVNEGDWEILGPGNITRGAPGIQQPLFDNRSNLLKTGSGGATIEIPFSNAGTVDIESGSLRFTALDPSTFDGGVLKNGHWVIQSGASLFLPATVVRVDGAVVTSGNQRESALSRLHSIGHTSATGNAPVDSIVNIDGSLNLTSSLQVNDTGELSGDGVITAPKININGGRLSGNLELHSVVDEINGVITAGHSPGQMTFQEAATLTNSTIEVELGGTDPALFDRYLFNGGVSFDGGSLVFSLIDGFQPVLGDQFDFLTASSITGLDTLAFLSGAGFAGYGFDILDQTGPGGRSLLLEVTSVPSSVPVPGAFWLFLSALAVLFGLPRHSLEHH